VIGSHKSGKSSVIKAFANLLIEQKEFFKEWKQTKATKALTGATSEEEQLSPNGDD